MASGCSCSPVQRNICPSCDAKRAAAFAAFLNDEVFEDVPHAMWVFTIPKMLRVYFLHHRELLGELSRCAYQTIRELMSAAAFEEEGLWPGMVSVVQTFGEAARFHPHVHALCSRGGWNAAGQWVPVPYLDHRMAEELFRHHVLRLLKAQGLLSDERIELLRSWKSTGFNTDDSVRIPAGESKTRRDGRKARPRDRLRAGKTRPQQRAGRARRRRSRFMRQNALSREPSSVQTQRNAGPDSWRVLCTFL